MTIVGNLAGTTQMVHEPLMRKAINGKLRCLVRHRENELTCFLQSWLLIVLTYHVKVATTRSVNIMDHLTCLSTNGFSQRPVRKPSGRGTLNTLHESMITSLQK